MSQNIYIRPCKYIFHVREKINYTQQYKCKSKKFGCVSLNDLHLHTTLLKNQQKFKKRNVHLLGVMRDQYIPF